MRRWAKVAAWSAGVLVLAGAGVAAAQWLLVRRTPNWYAPSRLTAAQRATAAHGVENTLIGLQSWSAGRHARQVSGHAASPSAAGATYPLSFTDAQLDAFFDKWADYQDRRAAMDKYVADPRLVVQDGRIIVVGQVHEVGLVVSLFVLPQVAADGRLRLSLEKVVAGVMTVPDSFFASQRAAIIHTLAANLPADQAAARFDRDGLANGPAATAAMDEMLLAMLRGRSAEPVVFVPVNTSAQSPLLPVRITAVTARDHTLSMTAQALTADERRDLLQRIKVADVPDAGAAAAAH